MGRNEAKLRRGNILKMDAINDILINSLRKNAIPQNFFDKKYIEENSNDQFSSINHDVFVIYNNGYKLEISYYKNQSKLHYVSFEKLDDHFQDLFFNHQIDKVNENLKLTINKTLHVDKDYGLGNFKFIFDDGLLESIFYQPDEVNKL